MSPDNRPIRVVVSGVRKSIRSPLFAAAVFVLAAVLLIASTPRGSARDETAGIFDYWTLVLSWSPTYCASAAGRRDQGQCGAGRRYAFVVHGLWPQYDSGWPDFCRGGRKWVPSHVIDATLSVMPSKRLIIHEWRKHGSCAGLRPEAYFGRIRKLFAAVKIPARYLSPNRPVMTTPDQMRRDFVSTNRWLKPAMISINCGNRRDRARLRDVRVCFDRKFVPVPCGANERRQCRAGLLVLPPVRGKAAK